MHSSLRTWLLRAAPALAGVAAAAGCSFPEHEFIPPGEFEKLKNGNSGGVGFDGGTGAFGAFGGTSGTGGSGPTGGSGGVDSGTGGASGGTGGAAGGTGGAPSCASRCGQSGPVPGSNPACYCDSSCEGFSNCCSDYATLCGSDAGTGGATGGTGGATGGTGGATGGTGGATGGTGGGTGGAGCKTIVVNEVATTGPGGGFDEFVELYNYGSCTASLAGWKIVYASQSGSPQADKWIGAGGDTLAAGAYWVIGGNAFTGAKNATLLNPGSGLGNTSGIALFDPSAAKVDSVGYGGVSPSHPFVETSAFSQAGTATKSVGRSPNGKDTNNNSVDFMRVNRSPGAAN